MTVYHYAVAFLVVILIGITKAGFAGGIGVLATPLFCLVVPARQAIAVLEPGASPERTELVQSWLAAASAMQDHPEFSTTEQLMAFVPEFELLPFGGEEAVPEKLQEKVRARVEKVVADASDPGEFQSTLNMAV